MTVQRDDDGATMAATAMARDDTATAAVCITAQPSTVTLCEIAQDLKTGLRFQSQLGEAYHYSTQYHLPPLGEKLTLILFLFSITFIFAY